MRFLIAAAATTLCLICSAAPTTSSKHVLHERRDGRPHNSWQKRSRADVEHVMPIRIALRERNIENAETYIYDVADPRSPNFGEIDFKRFSRGQGCRDSTFHRVLSILYVRKELRILS